MTEVLDFAKPIRFELAPSEPQRRLPRVGGRGLGRTRRATRCSSTSIRTMPTVVTDAERLRTALVNILTNARHAVQPDGARAVTRTARPDRTGGVAVASRPGVIVRTRYAAGRVAITVQDRGTGIAPTTWRTSSTRTSPRGAPAPASGLPIAKNIIEGLGGTHRGDQPRRRRHRDPASTCRCSRRRTRA